MKPVSVAMLMFVALHAAANEGMDEKERFQFFNNCEKIGLEIKTTVTGHNMVLINHEIRADIERRLVANRIYDANPTTRSAFLRVGISVHQYAFSIYVQYFKPVEDAISGISDSATTWQDGNYGTHNNDPDFILNAMFNLVEGFIANYRRVNKSACDAT